MKKLKSFAGQNSQLNTSEMKAVKGGFSFTFEAQIDICTVDAQGNAYLLYCDRRRKRVGQS